MEDGYEIGNGHQIATPRSKIDVCASWLSNPPKPPAAGEKERTCERERWEAEEEEEGGGGGGGGEDERLDGAWAQETTRLV